MKKLFFALILLFSVLNSEAQVFNGGIKAGLNYNSNGDLEGDILSIPTTVSSDGDTGFNIGIFAEMKLPLFLYIRPELIYTHTKSGYKHNVLNKSADLTIDKIDAPILVGFRILGIGRIFVGPSFQYIIDKDLSFDDLEEVSSTDFSVGVNFGIGVELGRFGVDLRWERGLSDSEVKYIDIIDDDNNVLSNVTVDTRPQQFILGVYYKFRKK